MRNTIVSWLALAAGIAALAWNMTHKAPKIAYAETSVLMSEFTEAIQARNQFDVSQKEWDKNFKALNDSLASDVEHMKAVFEKATAAQKDSIRSVAQKHNEELQKYSNDIKQQAQAKDKELMDPVVQKINTFLDIWGKQHGYDLILGTLSGGSILQANASLNVTAAVLKDLNEHYKVSPKP